MTPSVIALFLLAQGVGPAPMAAEVPTGVVVAADASFVAGPRAGAGVGATLAVTPHPRFNAELSLRHGSSWPMCPDCRVPFAADLKLRGTVVRHSAFHLAPWVMGSLTNGSGELTAGVALEGGGERWRVDASWPVYSTEELLTTLRIVPEHGFSWAWSRQHQTRLAVVGLEPGVALQHRMALGRFTLDAVARYGEEGFGAQLRLATRLGGGASR